MPYKPNEVKFCTKCVISNLRPITSLESEHRSDQVKQTTNFKDGICDACRWAEIKEKEIDWEVREKELQILLDKHRRKNEYDVVVPVSGGKDSCYVAHILKHKYKMNPLTVTWSPHIWTETGFKNHQNLIKTGFDNIMLSPNGDVHRKLTRLAILNLGHPFQPFIVGQRVVGPKIALKNNIKLVFYGENVAEYGNRIKDNYIPTMDPKLFTSFDIFNDETLLSGVTVSELEKVHNIKRVDLLSYQSPTLDEIERSETEVHYMSYYRKWVPQENYYYAMRNTSFEPSPTRTSGSYSKYAGLDDKLEWFHFYMMYIKFGMGRATTDAAQEIRSGKITREEAVNVVKKYDGEFPEQHIKALTDYCGITQEELDLAIEKFRPDYLWEKIGDRWFLKYQVS